MSKRIKAKKKRVEKKQRERSLPGKTAGRNEGGKTATTVAAVTTTPTIDRSGPAPSLRSAETGPAVAFRPPAHRGLAQLCQFLREHSGTARISSPATKNV